MLARAALVRLDVGRPDHLAPLLGVVDDELAKLAGRGCVGLQAQIDEPRLEIRAGKRLIHELIEDGTGTSNSRCRRVQLLHLIALDARGVQDKYPSRECGTGSGSVRECGFDRRAFLSL